MDTERVKAAVAELLSAVGEDPTREGLVETPRRVADMYGEIFAGLSEDPKDHLKIFNEPESDELVAVRDIPLYSMCEHHLLPFFGHVHIAYIPKDGRIIGLSKLARITNNFAARPQLQERLTRQIADFIYDELQPYGVAVVAEAEHLCMTMRGVRAANSQTRTTALRGIFRDNPSKGREVVKMLSGKADNIIFMQGGVPKIMGILNVTPDSFSDGGKYFDVDMAVEHAMQMVADGADIIDIGGQSTRPGHTLVSDIDEWSRIEPVLAALKGKVNIPISIDTFYPTVAERALSYGANIINDVGGKVDEEMAAVIAKHGATWVIMHADDITSVDDAATTVRDWLCNASIKAMNMGIAKDKIWLDPGIGFGKTCEQNYELIRETSYIKPEGFNYLVGSSRKRCIGAAIGDVPADERDKGTIAAHTIAICGGADIIRVHDVKGASEAAKVAAAVLGK